MYRYKWLICIETDLKVNRPILNDLYPAHIVANRAKDTDLERKLGILIQHGADIKQKHGSQGLTGTPHNYESLSMTYNRQPIYVC